MIHSVSYSTFAVLKRKPKRVTCSQCGCEYVYVMRAQATGTAVNSIDFIPIGEAREAKDNAYRQINKRLLEGAEPAQCPACGWFEPAAVREIRHRHARWMISLAIFLAALCVLFLGFRLVANGPLLSPHGAGVPLYPAGILAAAAVALIAARLALVFVLNPNAGHPDRRPAARPGAPRTFTKAEYDALAAWSHKVWQLAQNGEQTGPHSLIDVVDMLRERQVSLDALLWTEGRAKWTPLHKVSGLAEAAGLSAR